MKEKKKKTDHLLALIREGRPMTSGEQLRLTVALSVPAIVTQLSAIVMQYIDAAMVGSLGANASASIGLVSTTTWLFWGLCAAASTGFSVQVAHRIGAHVPYCAVPYLRHLHSAHCWPQSECPSAEPCLNGWEATAPFVATPRFIS